MMPMKTLPYQWNSQWPLSQKLLRFFVRFLLKNFVREILRAFHERIRSMFNRKISLTRTSSLATVSNGLLAFKNHLNWKEPRFSQSEPIKQTTHHQYQWNQCDARVLENWHHNHYMCAKIGQSKFLRQIAIVRFYPSL